MIRPAAHPQEGTPVQGFQQLLGSQQLNPYHQRGLLQGQQSKAAMDKGAGATRAGFALAPIATRPLQSQGVSGQTPATQLSLSALPNATYLGIPQPGIQSWGPQREGHPGSAFQQAPARDLASQGQTTLGATPLMQPGASAAQTGMDLMPAPEGQLLQGYSDRGMVLEQHQVPGMPSLPGTQAQGKGKRPSQVHFIPPGSAVIQPGPPMIHPGTTYNEAVSCHDDAAVLSTCRGLQEGFKVWKNYSRAQFSMHS